LYEITVILSFPRK
jgi:hypothetical protein